MKTGVAEATPAEIMLVSKKWSGAGGSEVGEQDPEVSSADAAVTVEVADPTLFAPEGDQDAQVAAVDGTVVVEIAWEACVVAFHRFHHEDVQTGF